MFKRICHTAITVKDLATALNFYQTFGFKEVCKYSDDQVEIRRLSLNDTELELFNYKQNKSHSIDNIPLSAKLKQPGWQHIAIGTDDITNALTWTKEKNLVDASCTITHGRTGINYFFVQDPEGNFVEIIENQYA